MCHQLSLVGQWLMGGKKWRSAKGCESVKVTEMCWVLAAKNKYTFCGYGEKRKPKLWYCPSVVQHPWLPVPGVERGFITEAMEVPQDQNPTWLT